MEESGTLAKASLELNDVLKAADLAARQYAESMKQKSEEEAALEALYIVQCAKAEAEEIIRKAQQA